jgi:Phosphate transport regulator (distant homolog of PhoU)
MSIRKKFFNFINPTEKVIFKRINEYSNYIITSTNDLMKMLDCSNLEISQYKETIRKNEMDGDHLTFELKNEITNGAITPNLMDSFNLLIDKCDDILDRLYYMSREILRYQDFLLTSGQDVKEKTCQYYSKLRNMLIYNLEAQKSIMEMLEQNTIEKMVSLWSRVSRLEEEVDDLKDELLDSLYKEANKLHYLTFLHLAEITHKIDDLLDTSQDIADILINVAITVTS